jgi:hypothetical protein
MSGSPPTRNPTTGVPLAIDSSAICGRLSMREGTTVTLAAEYTFRSSSSSRRPTDRTLTPPMVYSLFVDPNVSTESGAVCECLSESGSSSIASRRNPAPFRGSLSPPTAPNKTILSCWAMPRLRRAASRQFAAHQSVRIGYGITANGHPLESVLSRTRSAIQLLGAIKLNGRRQAFSFRRQVRRFTSRPRSHERPEPRE